ncbi:MAG: hypothetical protein JKY56_25505 [Kofleriaceae bacterium]|nr:hypothetical protein [Kofleriaceae bacterium]
MSRLALPSWFPRSALFSSLGGACCLCALSVLTLACSEVPENGQCEKYLDHIIDLQVNESSASPDDKIAHKKALKEKMKESLIKDCNAKIRSSQLECGLKATTYAEIEKCDE